MSRGRPLKPQEILDELNNISPSQSECGSDDEHEEGRLSESDDDFLPLELDISSASDSTTESDSPQTVGEESIPGKVPVRTRQRRRDAAEASKPQNRIEQGDTMAQPSSSRQRAKRKKTGNTYVAGGSTEEDTDVMDIEDAAQIDGGAGDADAVPANNVLVPGRALIGGEEKAKDGTVWTRIAPGDHAGRRGASNVITEKGGPTGYAKNKIEKECYSSALRLFLNEPLLRIIKFCTEKEAQRVLGDDSWSISLEELDAFISVLYARGACGYQRSHASMMWDKQWGLPFFAKTMSRNRFKEILRFLRFDDKETRARRIVKDKFCLVSEIWNKFIESCLACYKPGENIMVDEQLYPTKCRCPFLQYMSNKPDKFGIKFWVATDAEVRYVLNAFPYLGKDEEKPTTESVGENIVKRLVNPYVNKGRNVTVDNYFTSLKLVKGLKKSKTSLVGTLNRNRREVSDSLKNKSKDCRFNTVLYKHEDITLTGYQCKANKNVLILSSMHPSVQVETETMKKKPETILFYNKSKCGVDVVDQMSRKYTTRAGTRRWPVHVFYNILDLAMINAHSLYKLVYNSNISRKSFILKVVEEMSKPYAGSRNILQGHDANPVPPNMPGDAPRRQCQVGFCKQNKTKKMCSQCQKRMCGKCESDVRVCKQCELA